MIPRVLLVISNLEYGGAQRQVIELANHMDPNRYEVHVCSLSDYVPLTPTLHHADVRLHVIRKRWKFDFTVVPRLYTLCRELGISVVHSFLFDAEIASRLAGRMAGVSAVINSERNSNYRLKNRQMFCYFLSRSCMDITIANSTAGAAFSSTLLKQKISRYRVVHNGVDTERFKPGDRSTIRQSLGFDEDALLVGFFGSFKEQKNHPLAFMAMRRVFESVPHARLVLVGDELYGGMHGSSDYKHKMDRMVDELGIREQCIFMGNRNDVEQLYSACDLTILPSLFEGTPNVLLESMACGVPIVATDVADNSLIAPDGKVGFIVPLDDHAILAERIVRLLRDNCLRKQFGENARKWVSSEFSCMRLAEKTADVYDEALLAHGKRNVRRLVTRKPWKNGLKQKKCQNTLNIAMVTHFPESLNEPRGGVETVSVTLALALAELEGVNVHVVTLSASQKALSVCKSQGITIHRVPAPHGNTLYCARGSWRKILHRYLLDLSPDIVHAHDTYGLMVKKLPLPRVFTIHGFIHGDTLVSGKSYARFRSIVWYLVETAGWADQPYIVAISPYVREKLNGISKGVVYDIDNPVAEAFFRIHREDKNNVIFCAAVISPRKNTLALIEAFALIANEFPLLTLRLAGDVVNKEYGRQVREKICAMGVSERVHILGRLTVSQIQEEIKRASIFALISLEENSPMGIEEAMAAGVPVVTSNRCGMPYMVRSGENGFLVNPSDTRDVAARFRQLLVDDALREKFGIVSRDIAQIRFHPKVVAVRTLEVYREALGGPQ